MLGVKAVITEASAHPPTSSAWACFRCSSAGESHESLGLNGTETMTSPASKAQ